MMSVILWTMLLALPSQAPQAAGGRVSGRVTDETGGALPGVTVELSSAAADVRLGVTDETGEYVFEPVAAGVYQLSFSLPNFAMLRRPAVAIGSGATVIDVTLQLSLNAEVTVIGKRTFGNLADAENPAENLVGIAQAASQGAITARQLEVRPILRQGEVLETVPGLIITQHSGEGKANQYFLRGFNLDHGSDFATTVAGTPVNMPTHAHSQGYSDINFLIPELVAGVQFSKGPYFAEQGDFATAGAANINYATELERPTVHVEAGGYGFRRAFLAASPRVGRGHLLAAFEASTNAGPWTVPDSFEKVNGVARYSVGDTINGLSFTVMGYRGSWNATEASPRRAIDAGVIDRFGSIDPSDGGDTYRYSASAEWQRGDSTTLTKVAGYGLLYDLDLVSNFTFYLDDPVHGDQREQVDHRFTTGFRVSQRRLSRWRNRSVQHMYGVQVRNDDISRLALYRTESRVRLGTLTDAAVLVTSAGVYGQTDVSWRPWLRTMAGLRADGSRYAVEALDPVNSGTTTAGLISPKGGVTLGPWQGTELYVNAGAGFHSNNALGTTIVRDPSGAPAERVTPLVRARGAEAGVRTVAIPHLQSTVSIWTLRLASELVYNGDLGATEPGAPSERHGIEIANYYSPFRWLTFDLDVSLSRARFTEGAAGQSYVPEAVGTVVSAGAAVQDYRGWYGSLRWRYFGPRVLVEDNSRRSGATSLVNLGAGYQVSSHARVTADVFNLFDAADSDIEYYFRSRLRGEPLEGVDDVHLHPAVPRTLRVGLTVGF